jgi:hypothetical protein
MPRLLALALFGLAGCYLSHPSVPLDAPGRGARDAGRLDAPRPDAPVPLPDVPAVDGGLCTAAPPLTVTIQPVTLDAARCELTHAEGVAVYGVEPSLWSNGLRIHADLCPDADADCRCDYVLSNVGTDLVDRVLIPREGLILDVGPNYFFLSQLPTCECLGCPCATALVIHAASGFFEHPSLVPAELGLSRGAELCAAPSACETGSWALHGNFQGIEGDAWPGSDAELGILHLRDVSEVQVFGPCAACATCGQLTASWIAWVRH